MSDVQIDGMTDIAPENNVGINNRIYDPQVDAVQEFSVIVNGLQAEYGRYAGGVINVVTKGGTNQLHGTAYDYVRNPWFNANGFINNRNLRKRSGPKQNQYGYTLGGPVYIPHVYDGRNRTFFFSDLQVSASRSTSNTSATVPLAGVERRRLLQSENRLRCADHHLRPADGPAKSDRPDQVDPRSVPREHHQSEPDRPGGEEHGEVLSGAELHAAECLHAAEQFPEFGSLPQRRLQQRYEVGSELDRQVAHVLPRLGVVGQQLVHQRLSARSAHPRATARPPANPSSSRWTTPIRSAPR